MILITGGTGFLGSQLTRVLSSKYQVAITVRSSSNLFRIRDLVASGQVRLVNVNEVDIRDLFIEGGVTAVIHAATQYGRGLQGIISDHQEIMECNIELPLRLSFLCKEFNVSKYINIDSFYSHSNQLGTLSIYSQSKRLLREELSSVSKLSVINLVCQHIYGPMDNPDKFVTCMARSLISNDGRVDLTQGNQIRDFVFIDDVVSAVEILLDSETLPVDSYLSVECGTGIPTSIQDFMLLLKKITGASTKLNFGALARAEGESDYCVADPFVLKNLGWDTKTSLEQGLRKVVDSLNNY